MMKSVIKQGGVALLATGMILSLAACGPGSTGSSESSNEPSSVSTDLGSKSYELKLWDGAGLKTVDDALIKGFQSKYPNMHIKANYDPDNVSAQNGPRVISSTDAPDIARLTDVNTAVSGHHVISLEPYVKAYGWKVPKSQTQLYRADAKGRLGDGDLYALPNSYSVSGVYVNTKLTAKAGIADLPRTLDEFESDMGKAKDAGLIPMMTYAKDGGTSFAFQAMMTNTDSVQSVQDWILQKPKADFRTKGSKEAAQKLQDWNKEGYLPQGVNAIDASTALSRFTAGEGVFFPSGNWNLATMAKAMGDDVQFIPFPANSANEQPSIAANAGSFFGIPKNSRNKDAAACFLNYTQSDEARQIIANVSGYYPKTVEGQSLPKAQSALQRSMFDYYKDVFDSGRSTDFINNATAGIQSSGFIPNFQLLLDNSLTAQQFTEKIQQEYSQEVRH
ncbi:sugar ABC transporter substrate-binding protein [Bifidobacterium asteroides]|uniref:Sugar ABC transporter substrate-binding protein n=2 Tax=Bifidobacterium asteroides TaxID=1684 RepID=A0A318MS19_9BIFI|nr:sugar ABC transporter substrate-binding protein [Bifidobacterium asteroides]